MIPILAQDTTGINHTLELIENIGNIESIPGAVLVMGVLLFLGIIIEGGIFWRMNSAMIKAFERHSESQQQSVENAQSNYIVERDVTGVKIDTLVSKTDSISQVIEGYHTTLKSLTEQMGQTAQYLAETARALRALEQRVVASEADAIDRWEKVESVSKELKANMDEVGNGNKKILEELRSIRSEMNRVANSVEAAMASLMAAIDKITKPPPPNEPESNDKPEQDV